VMELVDGGDVLSYIRGVKGLSEGTVAAMFAQILKGVQFIHSRGVCHRDLKPENFLVVKGGGWGGARICVSDFGLAARVSSPQHRMHECVGTPYYQAPEMVAHTLPHKQEVPAAADPAAAPTSASSGGYTQSVDLWSLGVTLHLLLSGTLPFRVGPSTPATTTELRRAICTQPLCLASPPWPGVSPGAKDLVMGLLEKDPARRYTVEQCLAHRWLAAGVGGGRGGRDAATPVSTDITSSVPISPAVVRSLVAFTTADRLRSRALKAVAASLSAQEAATLRQQFFSMDLNGDTSLSHGELAHALGRMGLKVAAGEVTRLVAALDTNGDGRVDLEEFLSATAQLALLGHRDTAVRAFARFDRDGDGVISLEEVREALKGGGGGGEGQQEQQDLSDSHLEGLMARYASKGSGGSLSFLDFWRMLYPTLPLPRE
jgi:calcium-dependent protein kinase